MTDPASPLAALRDARFAQHATSPMPVWLWSADASRILWTNPIGAALFSAARPADLAARRFDRHDPTAAQIARLAATLPPGGAARLERLRGFGARLGRPLTCACSAVARECGEGGILIIAVGAAGPNP